MLRHFSARKSSQLKKNKKIILIFFSVEPRGTTWYQMDHSTFSSQSSPNNVAPTNNLFTTDRNEADDKEIRKILDAFTDENLNQPLATLNM